MPTRREDPRLDDEGRAERIRRRVAEVTEDAPPLARVALEAIVREHNPDLSGTADSAGRVGLQSGKVSELTVIAPLKPGGAARLQRIFDLTKGNMDGAQRVSTLHDMRFVFLEDNTKILFATAYDGDWDAYINDFGTKIPELMDLLFSNVEGWPGIDSPAVKDFIAEHQIDAAAWFVANPRVTVVDVRRYQRTEHALEAFLDALAGRDDIDPKTATALKTFTDAVATPEPVDY